MKRIYSAVGPPVDPKSYADWISKCNQKLSVSTRGLIAFTSSFCLNQPNPASISYHVYVADVNTPYQPYLLIESDYEFTIIEWDPTGTKLLVCDVRGSVIVFASKHYLASDFGASFKQVFACETFVAACWYHSGIVSTINVDNQNLKNPSNHLEYKDKILQSKFGASLRLFGGKPAEGCLLISRTGLVCCITLMADRSADVVTESISPLRSKIEIADISHSEDGSFVVGTSAGSINSAIAFYQINLTLKSFSIEEFGNESKRVDIDCKQFNSFHLNVMSQIINERENTCAFERVNQIKFVNKDSPSAVLVEVGGQNLSLLELWELELKKKTPIHSAILELKGDVKPVIIKSEENGSSTLKGGATEQPPLKEWSFKGNYITDQDLITIQTPRFKLFGSNRQLNVVLLAYKDSTICCLRKEDLQPVDEAFDLSKDLNMSRGGGVKAEQLDSNKSPYKTIYANRANVSKPSLKMNSSQQRTNQHLIYITDIQFSTNRTMFFAIDSMSRIHAIKLPALIPCQDIQDEETYLQYILEYCLVTGNDWWDAIVCTKLESIETICDKFYDAYERQPLQVKRKYSNRQLMIRASLYRCLNVSASLCKSSDCHTMIMLNSVSSTLKSMLRSQDQESPAVSLSEFLKDPKGGLQTNYFNCTNVISKINEKQFDVEANLIQCLQPLSQWVVDLAIFLIAALPQQAKSIAISQLPGAGLVHDRESLETLRELLIIIKIWSLHNEVSSPNVFKLNESLDVIASLYKLISYCYVGQLNGPDDAFLEERHRFMSNITVSQFSYFLAPTGVASPLLFNRANNDHDEPLLMHYLREPTMPELVALNKVEGSVDMIGNRKVDIVRNISLGAYPLTNIRHCTRCKSVSLSGASFNVTRVWEQRWMNTCVCGGSWVQSEYCNSKATNMMLPYQPATNLQQSLQMR